LTHLGLKPEGLLWLHKIDEEKIVLLLLWSGIDRFGPLELSKLMFQAYNAAALTKEIDPFSIELHSPKDILGRMLLQQAPQTFEEYKFYRIVENGVPRYDFRAEWVYHLQRKRRSPVDVGRDWRRFRDRVTALAA